MIRNTVRSVCPHRFLIVKGIDHTRSVEVSRCDEHLDTLELCKCKRDSLRTIIVSWGTALLWICFVIWALLPLAEGVFNLLARVTFMVLFGGVLVLGVLYTVVSLIFLRTRIATSEPPAGTSPFLKRSFLSF
jgi:hypothetical protein